MTTDLYCLDCVLSLAADSKHRSFAQVDFEDFPITESKVFDILFEYWSSLRHK